MRPRRAPAIAWIRAALLALIAIAAAAPASGVISLTAGPGGNGIIINTLLGADTFYNNGYFGQNAVVANVEAGAIWNGHESLTQLTTYISDPTITGTQLGQFDYHATAVGMTIAGQGQFFYYQAGIAPLANLWSASIATTFNGDGSFEITNHSFLYAYKESMNVGRNVDFNIGGGFTFTFHTIADVVNSSWGFEDPAGAAFESRAIDALALANKTTVVLSAGNSGPAGNTVGGPASGYNKIAVAALAADTTANPYTAPSDFSSRGPNDFYNPKTNTIVPKVRAAVDIAAPGEQLALAYYGGATGTNAGGTDLTGGVGVYYLTNAAGTSFAAPIVAGGAALLADYAHVNFSSHGWDGRVIKAVLLNSADKTAGWNNGQHPNLIWGVPFVTTQALDYATGAGRLNLARAYGQFSAGTTDNPTPTPTLSGGTVQPIGWLFGHVYDGSPTDYAIDHLFTTGESFTATLTWFIHRTLNDSTGADNAIATDDRFDNLDLEVWRLIDGQLSSEVAISLAQYNNVQHLSFPIPADGQYLLRVEWVGQAYDLTTHNPASGPLGEDFALAWSNLAVPEPASAGLILIVLFFSLTRRVYRRPCISLSAR